MRIRYQYSNHLGSASLELNDAGEFVSYQEYFPFGETAYTYGTVSTEYRFTGKERDEFTGLYYFGARYYAPWMFRWMNPDPSGPVDGLNVFVYCTNRPIIMVDPNGRKQDGFWATTLGIGKALAKKNLNTAVRFATLGQTNASETFAIFKKEKNPVVGLIKANTNINPLYNFHKPTVKSFVDGAKDSPHPVATVQSGLVGVVTAPVKNAWTPTVQAVKEGNTLGEKALNVANLHNPVYTLGDGLIDVKFGWDTEDYDLLADGLQKTGQGAIETAALVTGAIEFKRSYLTPKVGSGTVLIDDVIDETTSGIITKSDGMTVADPKRLNYSQNNISENLSTKGTVYDLIDEFETNGFDFSKKPLKVMEVDGQLVSYDNRRLYAAQKAGLKEIPIEVVDARDFNPVKTTNQTTWEKSFEQRRTKRDNFIYGTKEAVPPQGLKDFPEVIAGGRKKKK